MESNVYQLPINEQPFLSVVMRTQGKRMEAMAQTLDSLEAQDCQDFELLVMAHNVDGETIETIQSELEKHPGLTGRYGLWSVVGGSRSRPLNEGFSLARGAYINALDDDDLVLASWASSIKTFASKNPGKVIYSYVWQQDWTEDGDAPHEVSELKPTYCKPFTLVDLIQANRCPNLGCAFPREVFFDHRETFDETMDVVEDWDFLLQAVLDCGIVINETPTSIYRMWQTGQNSYGTYPLDYWHDHHRKIWRKLQERSVELPVGSINALLGAGSDAIIAKGDPKLFLDLNDYDSTTTILENPEVIIDGDWTEIVFQNLEALGAIRVVRIDPRDPGYITLSDFSWTLDFADGTSFAIPLESTMASGIQVSPGTFAFLKDDPFVSYVLDKPKTMAKSTCRFKATKGVADENVDRYIDEMVKIKSAQNPKGLRRLFSS